MGNHESAPEDVKAKFREALEKKQSHGGADVSPNGAHGKVDQAHRAEDQWRAADVPPQERLSDFSRSGGPGA